MARPRIPISGPPDREYTDQLMTDEEREVSRRVANEVYASTAEEDTATGSPPSDLPRKAGAHEPAAASEDDDARSGGRPASRRARPARRGEPLPDTAETTSIFVVLHPDADEVARIRDALGDKFSVADVLKAARGAMRRSLKGRDFADWTAPAPERRGGRYSVRLQLAVPIDILDDLKAEYDPLDIRPLTYLVQGRAERIFAQELDALVRRLASSA